MKLSPTLFLAPVLLSAVNLHAASTVTLNGTVRDFAFHGTEVTTTSPTLTGHPDFERYLGGDTGIVKIDLGGDETPQYNSADLNPTVTSAASFFQWFHDTPGVNLSTSYGITLSETAPASGVYEYTSSAFYPIDGLLGGNQGRTHNYSFTFELHTEFTYQPGQTFNFSGDDDVFVFINDKLVIDLGGVHSSQSASINLDTLGLTAGNEYDFDFFFAERHTTESNLKITTSIPLQDNTQNVPDGGASIALLGMALAGLGVLKNRAAR
jgi:fibro-slime domain-containing protein